MYIHTMEQQKKGNLSIDTVGLDESQSIMLNKRSQTQKTTFHMILFTWNSRNKTIPTENKSLVARSHGWQRELAKEGDEGNSRFNGNILHLDSYSVCMSLYIHQNWPNVLL